MGQVCRSGRAARPLVTARFKEWAYLGFAIALVSTLIARFAVGDGSEAWGWAARTGVLWGSCISSGGGSKRACQKQLIAREIWAAWI